MDNNNLDLLRKAGVDDYPIFTLKGYITYGKLLSNYDNKTQINIKKCGNYWTDKLTKINWY